jgi:hypothetical protein
MLKFKLGDVVKVVSSDHREDYFMTGMVTEIGEGFLPYRVHVQDQEHAGYWHKEDDLRLVDASTPPQEPAPVSAARDLLDTGDDAAALLNEAIKRVFDYASSTGKSRDKELAFIQQYIQAQAGQITGMIERMRDTEAKLAAATELAETNARLLANAQHELATVREWVKVCESNWHDNGAALAAILDERGVTEMTISNRYIYKTMDGSAASFPVDTKGNRIAANALAADGEGDK